MKSSGVDLEFELSGLLETLLLGMPPKLNEAMKYAVLSPGKRLRLNRWKQIGSFKR
jgi:geranylgeranyl pyrophosphate synthase